jgi:hypothetical protein
MRPSAPTILPFAPALSAFQPPRHASSSAALLFKGAMHTSRHRAAQRRGTRAAQRPFPPPWTAACFIVRDVNRQALAYVNFEEEPGRRAAARLPAREPPTSLSRWSCCARRSLRVTRLFCPCCYLQFPFLFGFGVNALSRLSCMARRGKRRPWRRRILGVPARERRLRPV